MTCHHQDNEYASAAEWFAERGLEGLGDAVSMRINKAMRLERSPHRQGYANGDQPEASCLRLVTAVAMEISQDWQTGRQYLNRDEENSE